MGINQIKQSAASILSDVKKQIKLDSIMVCDSALLSLENIQLISNLKWITRVPMTLKKYQRNNWILPRKSKSFPGNRPGNSRNN